MANTYKVLGQLEPAATTATTLYTVPAATQTVASTLVVANLGSSTTFRVAVRPGGETLADKHYIIYDNYINGNDSIFLTIGLSLNTTDVVTVYAGTANVAFNLFGTEVA
jgi:hypothetical protein